MKMSNMKKKIGVAIVALGVLLAGNAFAGEKWMTGDIHQHSYFTDGSYPINDLTASRTIAASARPSASGLYQKGVMPQGFRYGLDFQANSEHGGIRARDGFGANWNNTTVYPVLPAIGDSTGGQMWRWQSLVRTSDIPGYAGPAYLGAYDWIQTVRANYPDKLVMTGMEWNPPGHEHCSTGIAGVTAKAISQFEYRFDTSDTDGTSTTTTATTMGWIGKLQNSAYKSPDYSSVLGLNAYHNKTIDAVNWMQANHPSTGWIIPAHVERAGCGVGAWSIASFRDMNDNGPTVAFGMEGIPGHEKSSNRGELGTGSCGGGTYGGAGKYVAEVGGVWDNLLADGRQFYNFASSDFHNDSGADFWPGEYLKMYVKVKNAANDGVYTQEDIVAGLRSGNVFTVHGDIINALDFKVLYKTPYGTKTATMGETLSLKKGNKLTVSIRFKTPSANNCQAGVNASANYVCKTPSVHHVQLIQGRINPTKAKKLLSDGVTPNPAFNAVDTTVASIVKIFDANSWTTDAQGYTTMTFEVANVQSDMFFRIRGANLGYNVTKLSGSSVVYGTDAYGSPLKNTPGVNNADAAWDDLWFYSNPIFVKAL